MSLVKKINQILKGNNQQVAVKEIDPEIAAMIRKNFEQVKTVYHRRGVNGPIIINEPFDVPDPVTAFINFINRKVTINIGYLEKLFPYGDQEVMTRGVLSHEFGHDAYSPHSTPMIIYLSYMAQKTFKDKANIVYTHYIEFANEILVEREDQCRHELKERLRAKWKLFSENNTAPAPHWAAMYLSMNHHMGDLDVDVDLSRYTPEMQSEIDDAVKILNKLLIKKFSSLDRDNFGYQYVGMKNFGEAILPLLKYSNQSQSQGQGQVQQGQGQGQQSQGQGQGQQGEGEEQQGQGQGQGQGQQGEGSYLGLTPEGGSGAQVMLTPQMISQLPSSVRSALKKGLEPIVKNFNMGTYQQLKQFFFKQGQEQSGGSGGKGVGFGSIDEALANKEIRDYYKEAAKAYGTVYRPRKGMCISAEDDYLGKEQFRFNVPTHLIDVRFSGGKILPTVTHVKAKVKVPVLKKKKFLPRAIIYKDSSGSMPDPRSETCYATIAGSVIGLSYLQSGSQVGVAMFDSETSNIVNTYDPDEFLGVLCGYKGGGTAVDIEKLKEDLKSGKLDLPIDPDLDEAELKNNPYFQQILKSRGKSKYLKKNARITGYGKLDLNPATDFYIITDGGIANIKELLDFFNENEGYNPTIIHTGNYELNVEGYDQKTSGKYGKINVYKADTREDIIKMTQKATLANLRSKEQHFHSTQDNVY